LPVDINQPANLLWPAGGAIIAFHNLAENLLKQRGDEMQKQKARLLTQFLYFIIIALFAFNSLQPTGYAQTDSNIHPATFQPDAKVEKNVRKAKKQARRWREQGISNYQFDFQWICFCVEDYRRAVTITVRNNVITEVRYLDNNERVEPANFDRYRTIDELYALIKDAGARNADRIDITYDANLNFPMTGYIDYSYRLMDEEIKFKVSNLQLL
jgi:hypothetical protein